MLPDQNPATPSQEYRPFLDYLARQTGIQFELVMAPSYAALVQLFRHKEVDLAYFGGLTYVQAHQHYGANPLVMREVDTRFTSSFLVKGDSDATDLSDLKNKRFSFGPQLSTSGHLMPRHFMKIDWQLTPEGYFSEVNYSGAHDTTAYQVRDGTVDLGVVNSQIVTAMISDGRLKRDDIRVLWQSPPYTNYVWAVQSNLNNDIKIRLRDAFLGLSVANPNHRDILASLQARMFLPASERDFSLLGQLATEHRLLGSTP